MFKNKKTGLLILVLAFAPFANFANADYTFGTPTNLGPIVNGSLEDAGPFLSADGLELYFVSNNRSGGHGKRDMWVTTRATISDPWDLPVNLGSTVNSSSEDGPVSISSDGLELYFTSDRPGGQGDADTWITTRETVSSPWGSPVNLESPVNSPYTDFAPAISSDGLELYFCSRRQGGYDGDEIWVTRRETKDTPWSEPVNLGPTVNSPNMDATGYISPDGSALFFHSDRPGGYGWVDIWVTRRTTSEDVWNTPVNLGPVINTSGFDGNPGISADGSTLYFASNRSGGQGGHDLWQASIYPLVDLNGDDIVDSADMCILVDNWGTDNSLCDIGPMPWGDGIVDVQDLIVLAGHLKPIIIAHYRLNEMTGDIAHDNSIDGHDATIHGEPVWQSTGGKVAGALELDGIDDYIETPFILNPGSGSFGVFAWVKGDEPDKVIISQTGNFGDTWISIDPSGLLKTGFSGTYFGDLVSETIVNDGQWHHVGFVYDMDSFHRLLYVDGILVAEDATVVSGMPSDGGLYIGASKDLDTGMFFSGLIDDVRLYNQALSMEEIAALAQ